MVRSREQGALVIGARGRRRLRDDTVEGEDPLTPFDATAAAHLRRHDSFPHCPDILVNCVYDPGRRRGRPVRGVHGLARRPRRTADPPLRRRPGAVERSAVPIVGVEAMHAQLSDWLPRARDRGGAEGEGRDRIAATG